MSWLKLSKALNESRIVPEEDLLLFKSCMYLVNLKHSHFCGTISPKSILVYVQEVPLPELFHNSISNQCIKNLWKTWKDKNMWKISLISRFKHTNNFGNLKVIVDHFQFAHGLITAELHLMIRHDLGSSWPYCQWWQKDLERRIATSLELRWRPSSRTFPLWQNCMISCICNNLLLMVCSAMKGNVWATS